MDRDVMSDTHCKTCRFWSDKLAQSIGCGPMEAYCLSPGSKYSGKYTTGRQGCNNWKINSMGSIDSGSTEDPLYGNPYDVR